MSYQELARAAAAQATPAQSAPTPPVQASIGSMSSSLCGLAGKLDSLMSALAPVLRPLPPPSAATPKASLQAIAESPLHEQVLALRAQVDEAIDLVESIRARLTV